MERIRLSKNFYVGAQRSNVLTARRIDSETVYTSGIVA